MDLRSRLRRLWPVRKRAFSSERLARLLAERPVPRHVVFVVVQQLDRSVTSGIRYARTLRPDVVRGLHAVIDPVQAARVAREWEGYGLGRLTLELRDAPDRRLERAVLEAALEELDGHTHASVVVPRRVWRPAFWALIAHDHSAAALVRAVTHLGIDHLTVTVVPFVVGGSDQGDQGAPP